MQHVQHAGMLGQQLGKAPAPACCRVIVAPFPPELSSMLDCLLSVLLSFFQAFDMASMGNYPYRSAYFTGEQTAPSHNSLLDWGRCCRMSTPAPALRSLSHLARRLLCGRHLPSPTSPPVPILRCHLASLPWRRQPRLSLPRLASPRGLLPAGGQLPRRRGAAGGGRRRHLRHF